mgnify:CR=1 FL=1
MTYPVKHVLVLAALVLLAVAIGLYVREPAQRAALPAPQTTDILVLGDSQLSFGAGPVLSRFFADLPYQCRNHLSAANRLSLPESKRFGMIGVRSTSLQSWTSTGGRAWELLCHKDKRWGVNASVWGTLKPADRRYVQIGEGENFQFCRAGGTPLQQLFADAYYLPELLMIFVGGNGAARLAGDLKAARRDVAAFLNELPNDTGCVFMMTAPVYSPVQIAQRRAAQANLKIVFAEHGERCTFVAGHTPETRAAIEGKARFFRRREDGSVKDPYHANEDAAQRFLESRRPTLCRALAFQLQRRSMGGAS